MSIQAVVLTKKNGTGTVEHHWETDLSLPKMWIEGNEYKFNTQLVKSTYINGKK